MSARARTQTHPRQDSPLATFRVLQHFIFRGMLRACSIRWNVFFRRIFATPHFPRSGTYCSGLLEFYALQHASRGLSSAYESVRLRSKIFGKCTGRAEGAQGTEQGQRTGRERPSWRAFISGIGL